MTLVLLLVLATVVLAPLAERLLAPYPAVLLGCGLVLALVPGLPVPEVSIRSGFCPRCCLRCCLPPRAGRRGDSSWTTDAPLACLRLPWWP